MSSNDSVMRARSRSPGVIRRQQAGRFRDGIHVSMSADLDDDDRAVLSFRPSRGAAKRPASRRRRRRTSRANAGEDDAGERAPVKQDSGTTSAGVLGVSSQLAAAPPPPMGAAENYDSMADSEKRCFEAYVASQLDSSLEVGSEQWTAAFGEKLQSGGIEAWNALSADDRAGFCAKAGAAPEGEGAADGEQKGKGRCGKKARSRSRAKGAEGAEGAGGAEGGEEKPKKKKRRKSKPGWTCYTHFLLDKLRDDEIKLNRENFAETMRSIASAWYELSDDDWKSYKCKHKRRKPKQPKEPPPEKA